MPPTRFNRKPNKPTRNLLTDMATVRAPSPASYHISAIPLAGRRLTSPVTSKHVPGNVLRSWKHRSPNSQKRGGRQQNYQTFKTVYNSLFDLEQVPVDMWNTYKRVYQDYARYAGIPEYVRYTLDHEFPYYGTLEDVTAYYQSAEWDRTNGWDPNERVSLPGPKRLKNRSNSKSAFEVRCFNE